MSDARAQCTRAVLAHLDGAGAAVLACSGGPDSLALVAAAAACASRANRELLAVVVDHGLQVDSEAVAHRAAQWCAGFGVRAEVVAVAVTPRADGPEAAARRARYAALREAAGRIRADRILLGHTMDDQAETVLMRLSRGSGARTLSGMRAISGDLHRPFLSLPRQIVHASLEGHPSWQDPHNTDPRFLRSRVRAEVMPVLAGVLGRGAVVGLARSAELLADDDDALSAWADREWPRLQRSGDVAANPTTVCLDADSLSALPRAVRGRILHRAAVAAGAPAGALTRDHLRAVDDLVSAWRGQGAVALPGPVTAARAYGRLCLARQMQE